VVEALANGVALAGTVQSLMFESMVFSNTAYKYDVTKQTLTVSNPFRTYG
jgi:hypothetical protein